ncbi:MAG TPA: 30S ribosomal protein S8 [Candidatus Paceibacterota bacterium]|nr:30S ribosomal protein S8 [Candidatus Paceibacterota bacterium]
MDPISDMLNRIKNAQAVRHERVAAPFSQVKFRIAQLLVEAGYLVSVEKVIKMAKKAEVAWLDLVLKYADGRGAISGIRLVSRPSRHIYISARNIKPVRSGYGLAVLSTSKGVMTGTNARKENIGGEVMFEIW